MYSTRFLERYEETETQESLGHWLKMPAGSGGVGISSLLFTSYCLPYSPAFMLFTMLFQPTFRILRGILSRQMMALGQTVDS